MRRGEMGFWLRLAVCLIKPTLLLLTRRDWRGREHVPRTGGVILAVNHISQFDPFPVAHFVYDCRRLPRFLAKAELFRVPFVRTVMRGAAQIPVYRGTANAAEALRDAVAALDRGECVVLYPEGTCTRDPDGWPMRARTGVARLALMTGAPVVPVAQWGAQQVLPYGEKRPHLLRRPWLRFLAGPPVDLSAYRDQELTSDVLRKATDEVMTDVRDLLGELRGERPPQEFHPNARAGRRR